jgi:hypothetical protein
MRWYEPLWIIWSPNAQGGPTLRHLTEAELEQVSGGQSSCGSLCNNPPPTGFSNQGQVTAFAVHSAKELAKLSGEKVGPAVSAAAHG